jgi:hypothetical protein
MRHFPLFFVLSTGLAAGLWFARDDESDASPGQNLDSCPACQAEQALPIEVPLAPPPELEFSNPPAGSGGSCPSFSPEPAHKRLLGRFRTEPRSARRLSAEPTRRAERREDRRAARAARRHRETERRRPLRRAIAFVCRGAFPPWRAGPDGERLTRRRGASRHGAPTACCCHQ